MANFKSITSSKETGFAGIEFIKTDKSITEIVIGGKVRIKRGESYNSSLVVLIEQPFEEAKRYRATGKIEGFPDAVSYHENKYEADSAAAVLEDAGAKTSVDHVDVLIAEDGSIQAAEPSNPSDDPTVPF